MCVRERDRERERERERESRCRVHRAQQSKNNKRMINQNPTP